MQFKETLLYLFFGGITTAISILSFAFTYDFLCINEHISNIVSWVLAVSFAFFTNRTWVFKGFVNSNENIFKQALSFCFGRIFTLLVEEVIVLLFITWLGFAALFVKVVAQVIVLILNYLISKFFVFKSSTAINT